MCNFTGIAVILSLSLVGCAQHVNEDQGWGRIDCKENTPPILKEYERARLVCVPRAEAAGVSAVANMPVGISMSDMAVNAFQAGKNQTIVKNAEFLSCMAEHGFAASTRREWNARCISH